MFARFFIVNNKENLWEEFCNVRLKIMFVCFSIVNSKENFGKNFAMMCLKIDGAQNYYLIKILICFIYFSYDILN